MSFITSRYKTVKVLIPILLLSSLLFMMGCYSSAPSRGWSGCVISDGILYVGTIEGKIIALDAINGTKLDNWEGEIEGPSSGGFGCSSYISKPMSTYGVPVVKNGVVYVGGYDGTVYAFEKGISGIIPNEFPTDGTIVGSPVIDDESNTLFVSNSDGNLYALNLDLSLKWGEPFKTDGKIWATPAIDNGVVYIGSADHRLYAVDIETGEEIWHFKANGAILSTAYIYEDTVYIGACDNKFYAIDVNQEGKEAQAKQVFNGAGNWYWTKALAFDGKIYVGNLDHNVYAINIEDFNDYKVVLKTEGRVCTPPVLVKVDNTKYMIVVGSEDGNVYTVDPDKDNEAGKPLCDLEAPILAPIYTDTESGIIYVHAQDGTHTLYAIEVEPYNKIWSYITD